MASAQVLAWSSSALNVNAVDTSIYRAAAGVLTAGTGQNSGKGWFQNTGGSTRVSTTADVITATASLANGVLTNLSQTLISGRNYSGRLVLFLNNATAADGVQVDFGGGTVAISAGEFGIAAAAGATVGVRTSTAVATPVTLTALLDANDVIVDIPYSFVTGVGSGGTLIPRVANTSGTGTIAIRKISYLLSSDMAN